jgi:hypothetical protein
MNQQISEVEPGLRKALEHLQSVLISGENLEAWAVQRRAFALKHRRLLLAATSGRLLRIQRNLLGGFDLRDMRWQDLEEVRLKVGILAADLTVRVGHASDLASQGASGSETIVFPGLRKALAESVYRICQAQDQAWREKRRIRELEELRARAGGIVLGAAGASALSSPATPGAPSEAMRRLQEAKQMLDAKLITDAEYEAIKARIFAS